MAKRLDSKKKFAQQGEKLEGWIIKLIPKKIKEKIRNK